MMRQVFFNFLFYLEIVNKIRQASNTISEVTHSIKKPCGRCDIKFIDSLQPSVFKFCQIYIEKLQSKPARC